VNYSGPGIYRHYKGGLYEVLGSGLKEDTVVKEDNPDAGPEVVLVVYRPVPFHEKESLLDDRNEDFWLRELNDFNASVMTGFGAAPRFRREQCIQCGNNASIKPAGSLVVCANCGNNWPT
jgi:hypothetical protein